jgi:alkyl sulfatase BDS1-like metallo-beta-lactamase superfamily hydrolase
VNNYTFVEGKTGLIAFDSGVNVGQGQEVLKLVQEKVNNNRGCQTHRATLRQRHL